MTPPYRLERLTLYYDYVRICGVIPDEAPLPSTVTLRARGETLAEGVLNIPSYAALRGRLPNAEGLSAEEKQLGLSGRTFVVSALVPPSFSPTDLSLSLTYSDGTGIEERYAALQERLEQQRVEAFGGEENRALRRFMREIADARSVVEIGSRARSGLSRRSLFQGKEYTGVDVLDGENVEVVADAHQLSSAMGGRTFDAAFSVSTFEHLLMPWKAAVEINRVLNDGGLVYVATHQALGLHDMPWDFWRFSDEAWKALFNHRTGFAILETALAEPMALTPERYTSQWAGHEMARGYAVSAVVAQKTGPATVDWPVLPNEIVDTSYPPSELILNETTLPFVERYNLIRTAVAPRRAWEAWGALIADIERNVPAAERVELEANAWYHAACSVPANDPRRRDALERSLAINPGQKAARRERDALPPLTKPSP